MQKNGLIWVGLMLGLCAIYAQDAGEALSVDPSGDVHVYENLAVEKDAQVTGRVTAEQGYFSGDGYRGNLHMFTVEHLSDYGM